MLRTPLLSILLMLALGSGSTAWARGGPTRLPSSTSPSRPDLKDLHYEVHQEEPWYCEPADGAPPCGVLPKWSRVAILRTEGAFSEVWSQYGVVRGYVRTMRLVELRPRHSSP